MFAAARPSSTPIDVGEESGSCHLADTEAKPMKAEVGECRERQMTLFLRPFLLFSSRSSVLESQFEEWSDDSFRRPGVADRMGAAD